MPLSINTNDSFRFEHELKTEMHEDYEYVKSLEKEVDELESEKADFSNIYDLLLEECTTHPIHVALDAQRHDGQSHGSESKEMSRSTGLLSKPQAQSSSKLVNSVMRDLRLLSGNLLFLKGLKRQKEAKTVKNRQGTKETRKRMKKQPKIKAGSARHSIRNEVKSAKI
ncbi:hypothetical protein Tco_0918696 [Tanacetum coccineum]